MRVKLLARCAHARLPPETFLISATRLGGRHGYDAAGAPSHHGRRGHRVHEGAEPRAAGRAGQGSRLPRRRRKTAALADALVEEALRDPGAVEIGHADGLRWTVGARRAAGRATAPGRGRSSPTTCSWSPVRPAASSRRSPPTWQPPRAARSTCSTSCPRPTRPTPTSRASRRPRRPQARARRAHARGAASKPTPELVERELARIERAARRSTRSRRSRRPAAPRTATRSTSPTPTRSAPSSSRSRRAQRPHRRAAPRGRPRDQPLPARQAAAGVRPRLRRQGRRLVQPPAGAAARLRARRGRRLLLDRRAVRQRRPDRLRAPPTTCCARRSRSSAPRPATRRRDRLDGLGEHRDGEPRLDPEGHGDGRHRHAAAASRHPGGPPRADRARPAARSSSPGALGVLAEERHATAGSTRRVPTPRPAR